MTQENKRDSIEELVEELMKKPTASLEDVSYTETISIYCKYCG